MISFLGQLARSLGVFHPNAPVEDKIHCKSNNNLLIKGEFLAVALRLYDLRQTGFIERESSDAKSNAIYHTARLKTFTIAGPLRLSPLQ
ncbi:hypothetical protein POTOM_052902 [Populus tomentosa]|uniref:Uncharacterized protein n=1 Tax=Populus tomentosa TaxID=118781 RepID=A0A8X7Y7A3_POPTO|nr:hypothetical protein POTOM_052902 [Populus tomentosa]